MLRTHVSDQFILNVLSEPFDCRRDGGRSSPACQAPSGITSHRASHLPAVLTYLLGEYPDPQSLTTAAGIRISSPAPLQLSAWIITFLSFIRSVYPPLVSATARVDVYAVGTFILGRIVINHVQYSL
jgi:hypothetical protein